MIAKGSKTSFGDNENVLQLTVVMNAELCEYTKSFSTVQFKWVDCTLHYFTRVL